MGNLQLSLYSKIDISLQDLVGKRPLCILRSTVISESKINIG